MMMIMMSYLRTAPEVKTVERLSCKLSVPEHQVYLEPGLSVSSPSTSGTAQQWCYYHSLQPRWSRVLPSKQETVRNAKDVQFDNYHQDTLFHKTMKNTKTRSSQRDLIVGVRGLDITGKFGASIFHGRHIPDWNCMRIFRSIVWINGFGTGRLDWYCF